MTTLLLTKQKAAKKHVTPHTLVFATKKVPSVDSTHLPPYGKKSIEVLFNDYGKAKPALTSNEEEQ